MFRRRRAEDGDEVEDDLDGTVATDDESETAESEDSADDAERSRTVLPPQPTTGPWDLGDLPNEDSTARLELGCINVPLVEGIELRVEVADDVVVAAALVDGLSQLTVNAFAAPKTAGLWDDVRNEIADSLRSTGGSAEHSDGPFGAQLDARIPDESGGRQAARFIGVDGPRWFLRGLITGPAATDSLQAKRLEEVFRGIVVVRGGDAMAPRDALPLHLPREAVEQMAEAEANPEDRVLELTERGPEITEIR